MSRAINIENQWFLTKGKKLQSGFKCQSSSREHRWKDNGWGRSNIFLAAESKFRMERRGMFDKRNGAIDLFLNK